jgi:hypothetical protein
LWIAERRDWAMWVRERRVWVVRDGSAWQSAQISASVSERHRPLIRDVDDN